jgi:hypothetical protein
LNLEQNSVAGVFFLLQRFEKYVSSYESVSTLDPHLKSSWIWIRIRNADPDQEGRISAHIGKKTEDRTSVSDPHRLYVDPGPDQAFSMSADPDPALKMHPDPVIH